MLAIFVLSLSVAHSLWSQKGTDWTFSGWYSWEWAVFVMLALCNVSGTLTSLPTVGAFVKRLVDPWSYRRAASARHSAMFEAALGVAVGSKFFLSGCQHL